MTNQTQSMGLSKKALAVTAKLLLPLAVATAGVIVVAGVKGWPVVSFWHHSGPKHDPADWCREHGVPESLCTLCHPELKKTLLWCHEHGLPEALCTLCHPELAEHLVMCTEHNLPKAYCPTCSPPATAATTAADGAAESRRLELPLVKLASAATVKEAGIEWTPAQSETWTLKITCNGLSEFNRNLYAQVRPRVEGIVHSVQVDVGDKVGRGDVLAVIDSATLGEAKAEYFGALATLDLCEQDVGRLRNLVGKQVVAGKRLLQTESRFKEAKINVARARQRLLNLGCSGADVQQFIRLQDTTSLLSIMAPLDGVIVRRRAVLGEAVQPSDELFAVVDLATMWVELDLYENDLRGVSVGQPVTFSVPNLSSAAYTGKVIWISPEVDPRTRTTQVRAAVQNADGLLRAGMYGSGQIEISEPRKVLVVPRSAVQQHDDGLVAFVQKENNVFEPRWVTIGQKEQSLWEVTSGLKPDEQVVTTGSFLMKTELNKGSIGASCCGD